MARWHRWAGALCYHSFIGFLLCSVTVLLAYLTIRSAEKGWIGLHGKSGSNLSDWSQYGFKTNSPNYCKFLRRVKAAQKTQSCVLRRWWPLPEHLAITTKNKSMSSSKYMYILWSFYDFWFSSLSGSNLLTYKTQALDGRWPFQTDRWVHRQESPCWSRPTRYWMAELSVSLLISPSLPLFFCFQLYISCRKTASRLCREESRSLLQFQQQFQYLS